MDRKETQEIFEITEDQLNKITDRPYKRTKLENDREFVYIEEHDFIYEIESIGFDIKDTNVVFDTFEEYVSIIKHDENMTEDLLVQEYCYDLFDKIEDKYNVFKLEEDYVRKVWRETEPVKATEVLEKYQDNTEQRMVALQYVGAGNVLRELDAELVDQQTLTKRQTKTIFTGKGQPDENKDRDESQYENITYEYEDTYTLYRIEAEKMGIDPNEQPRFGGFNNDEEVIDEYVYIVQCKDASSDREFHLFVDPSNTDAKVDAISAIASTLYTTDDNGEPNRPLTKEEYVTMESET